MAKVLNKRTHGVPAGAFYGGRGSIWGNKFVMGRDGDRDEVCDKFQAWFRDQHHLLRRLPEIRGMDGVCFCAPQRCHLNLVVRLANAPREELIRWWRCEAA